MSGGLVRGPRDLGAGLIYAAVGLAAVVIARNYDRGTGTEMGPGYFPTMLGWILVAIGAAAMVRAFLRDGEPIGRIAVRATLLVVGATALFGWLLLRAGLPIALLVMTLAAAAASSAFRLEWRALAGLVLLVVFCTGIFVIGLGLPMPLLGSWFGEG